MNNEKQIMQAKSDCNKGKQELMRVQDRLFDIGAIKQAEQLGKIIYRLESWQNR